RLTSNMRRIVLQGPELTDFPVDQEGGYVKLVFEPAEEGGKPTLRSYTIRAFDASEQALTLDFVDHGDGGPASAWANRAEPGDSITIRGPGDPKLAAPEADWFLLAGDMSALPALAVNLENLPADARGYALIEVLSEDDRQPIDHPEGIELTWLVNPDTGNPNALLAERVPSLPWLPGTPYPWFAGEFSTMRTMRRYFRDESGISRHAMYCSCYWKLGDTDEGMKRAKKLDPEA
ncbi:MAG: siderophore-interacting protein, partial [Pseudomonadota bacterium]